MRYPRHSLAHYQYFLQYHQRYSLITPPTLADQPPYTQWHTNYVTLVVMPSTLACQPPMLAHYPGEHATHITHASSLACHPCKHATHPTHASMPPTPLTLVHHLRKHSTHATHASTPPTPPTLARIARFFSNSLF